MGRPTLPWGESLKKLILLLALLLAGCLQSMLWRHEDVFSNTQPNTQLGSVVGTDECYDTGPCLCFVCTNKTSGWWIFAETSLAKGSCKFMSCSGDPNDPFSIKNILSDENTYLKTFMIGQGATFAEFDEANQYAGGLPLAVKWLVRTDGRPPYIPSRKMAECYLEHNVIPAYVIYTGGKLGAASGSAFAAQLAAELKDIGPVIVAPEARFNATNPSEVSTMVAELAALRGGCPNCLLAFVPRDDQAFGNKEAVMRALSQAEPHIDLVGRGVLLNELSTREPPCDAEEALLEDIVPFAREVMKKFHKPTIILFYGASEGGACGLTRQQIADFNDYIMRNIPMLVSAGIIGIAHAQFQDRASPLASVSDTGWGMVDIFGAQKSPSINVWFNRTRIYFSASEDFGNPQVPLVFSYSGKQGRACEFMSKLQMSALQPPDYSAPELTGPLTPVSQRYNCRGSNPNLIGSFNPTFVDNFPPAGGGCIYDLAVRVAAESCELDPNFYRALLLAEGQLSAEQIAGSALRACDAWSGVKACANASGITKLDTVGFFAALAYKKNDIAGACGYMVSWNATHASDPDYAAWIYVCAGENVCVQSHTDENGNVVCDKWELAMVKEPFPCVVAATYNSLRC